MEEDIYLNQDIHLTLDGREIARRATSYAQQATRDDAAVLAEIHRKWRIWNLSCWRLRVQVRWVRR